MTALDTLNPFSSNDEESGPTGASAIRAAVNEIESLEDGSFEATLGEPTVVQGDGQFFTDIRVIVPVLESPYDSANKLVYDLPEGRDGNSLFLELLEAFNLDFETMEDLKGKTAPVSFIGGNVVVDWDLIEDEEETPEETESEEDSPPSGSTVTVDETTISSDGGDDGE